MSWPAPGEAVLPDIMHGPDSARGDDNLVLRHVELDSWKLRPANPSPALRRRRGSTASTGRGAAGGVRHRSSDRLRFRARRSCSHRATVSEQSLDQGRRRQARPVLLAASSTSSIILLF